MTIGRIRNVGLVVDTGVTAATNVLLILVAARTLEGLELTTLTLAQLYLSLSVGLQRALFMTPVFAASGAAGQTLVLPVRWVAGVSILGGLVLGTSSFFGLGGETDWRSGLAIMTGATVVVIAQDYIRYCFISRSRVSEAIIIDTSWLLLALTIIVVPYGTWQACLALWTLGGAAAALIGLALLLRNSGGGARASIREVLVYGKWSGLEAAVSGVSTLAPFVFSALVMSSSSISTYRILQSALGPLNIISAAMLVIVGLGASQLSDPVQIAMARRRAYRQSALLTFLAAVILAVSLPALLLISGYSVRANLTPVLVTFSSGLLGAAAMSVSSLANALGGQRYGFMIRVVVLVISLSLVVMSSDMSPVHLSDPIGSVMLCSAVGGAIGWWWALARLVRRAGHSER